MDGTPPLQPRPKLHGWLIARGLGVSDLGKRWNISPQGASRYLLPFGHERRIVPNEGQMADVLDWTAGEIGAADWYPTALTMHPLPASIGEVPASALAREVAS